MYIFLNFFSDDQLASLQSMADLDKILDSPTVLANWLLLILGTLFANYSHFNSQHHTTFRAMRDSAKQAEQKIYNLFYST